MQTIIYFIRHGEVLNPQDIFYVKLPGFRLSEKGSAEIAETAKFLKDKQISALFASPLLRAQQTAKIIQKQLKLPKIHTNKQLLEVNTAYQGKHFSELDPLQSEVYLKPLQKTDETMEAVGARMGAFVRAILKQHPGKRIAVCSHGDPIMILYALTNKKPLSPQSVKAQGYSKYGEVFELTDHNGQQTMQSVFIPENAK